MPNNYSNFTQFGIKNNVERYAYVGWQIFVVICSLLGDTTILVASIKYKAFKIHDVVVVVIQHVAACDLLNAVTNLLPAAISAIRNSGGSSKMQNSVKFFIYYYLNTAGAAFIAAMTLGKLLVLKYPLRVGRWSKRRAHKICAGIWLVTIYNPALHLLVDQNDVTFDYRTYHCTYMYTKSVWDTLLPVTTIQVLFVPNVTIIVSTILIIRIARRLVNGTREKVRWQGITTVVLTATVYTLSILPITVYFVAEPMVEKDPFAPGPFFIEFYRIATSVLNYNILANFFVYSLTVDSFRSFLKKQFRNIISFLYNTVDFAGMDSIKYRLSVLVLIKRLLDNSTNK